MRTDKGNQSTQRNLPAATLPTINPHNLTWEQTQATMVGSWQLTAWAMAWPQKLVTRPFLVVTAVWYYSI
jgi:hypothetical protein